MDSFSKNIYTVLLVPCLISMFTMVGMEPVAESLDIIVPNPKCQNLFYLRNDWCGDSSRSLKMPISRHDPFIDVFVHYPIGGELRSVLVEGFRAANLSHEDIAKKILELNKLRYRGEELPNKLFNNKMDGDTIVFAGKTYIIGDGFMKHRNRCERQFTREPYVRGRGYEAGKNDEFVGELIMDINGFHGPRSQYRLSHLEIDLPSYENSLK